MLLRKEAVAMPQRNPSGKPAPFVSKAGAAVATCLRPGNALGLNPVVDSCFREGGFTLVVRLAHLSPKGDSPRRTNHPVRDTTKAR